MDFTRSSFHTYGFHYHCPKVSEKSALNILLHNIITLNITMFAKHKQWILFFKNNKPSPMYLIPWYGYVMCCVNQRKQTQKLKTNKIFGK